MKDQRSFPAFVMTWTATLKRLSNIYIVIKLIHWEVFCYVKKAICMSN